MNDFGTILNGEKNNSMDQKFINQLNEQFKDLNLKKSFDLLGDLGFTTMAFSTSFGQEDQVLTDFIFKNDYPINVFTLDTGRIFEETYAVYEATQKKYKKPIVPFFPERKQIETLLKEKGPNSFYNSIEDRKECCNIRKIKPLKKALEGVDLWITGLRSGQSSNRNTLSLFTYDEFFGVVKFNPLLHWTLVEITHYLETNKVPQNTLHAKGYPSIGCAPCTRAISPGEDIRAGRWWWETSKKECGLHQTQKTSIKM